MVMKVFLPLRLYRCPHVKKRMQEWIKATQWATSFLKKVLTSKLSGIASARSGAACWTSFPSRHTPLCNSGRWSPWGRLHSGWVRKSADLRLCTDSSQGGLCPLPKCHYTATLTLFFNASPFHQTVLVCLLLLHVPSYGQHTRGDPFSRRTESLGVPRGQAFAPAAPDESAVPPNLHCREAQEGGKHAQHGHESDAWLCRGRSAAAAACQRCRGSAASGTLRMGAPRRGAARPAAALLQQLSLETGAALRGGLRAPRLPPHPARGTAAPPGGRRQRRSPQPAGGSGAGGRWLRRARAWLPAAAPVPTAWAVSPGRAPALLGRAQGEGHRGGEKTGRALQRR